MSRGDIRRRNLFGKYARQLHFLADNGWIPVSLEHSKTYICPICMKQFSEGDLEDTSSAGLTLEDAPPQSLGGSVVALTCKKCNNTCGHEIDKHLSMGMLDIDNRSFLPGADIRVTLTKDGRTVNGRLLMKENGIGVVSNSLKNNNPKILQPYISTIVPDIAMPSLEVKLPRSKVDDRIMGLALLKAGYMLFFSKFGYAFLFDSCYESIRAQLQHPEKDIYPLEFWTSKPFLREHEGVHFLTNDSSEGIFSIFALKTTSATRRFGVFIPLPGSPLIGSLKTLTSQTAVELNLSPVMENLVEDPTSIENVVAWRRDRIIEKMGFN